MPGHGSEGIDIASFQHPNGAPIDWVAVKNAGIDFVMVKATQGMNYINPYWQTDVANAKAAGLDVGTYDFGMPGTVAVDEANHYKGIVGGLPKALDDEVLNGFTWAQVGAWSQTFLDQIRTILLYCNLTFYDDQPGCPWGFWTWLADPSHPDSTDKNCHMHQWGTTTLLGIQGDVDRDRWLGTDAEYASYFQKQPLPPPPPPPTSPTDPVIDFWKWFKQHHHPWGWEWAA